MSSITLWNRGKRTFSALKNSAGETIDLHPEDAIEMEEVAGLRLLASYPKDLTSTKTAGISSEDLRRREQSIRDREKRLDEREKALDAREKALEGKTTRGPGRPPKAVQPEASTTGD
jgi:macrodomain Ter protein organizer (MatP/YcbG family)